MPRIEINAAGQTLGRLATRIALTLRGKDTTTYRPDRLAIVHVTVINASQVKIRGRKSRQKVYYRFSGYPGGLKKTSYHQLLLNQPTRIIQLAVKRMLPKNRLQEEFLRNLTIKP